MKHPQLSIFSDSPIERGLAFISEDDLGLEAFVFGAKGGIFFAECADFGDLCRDLGVLCLILVPEFLEEKEYDGDEHCHGANDAGDEHDEQVPMIGEAFGLPAVLGGLPLVYLAHLGPDAFDFGPEDFDFGPEDFDFGVNVFLHPLPQCLVRGGDNILNLFVFCYSQFRECGSIAEAANQQQNDSELFHEISPF